MFTAGKMRACEMQMELSDRRRRDLVERAERNAEAFRLLAGHPFFNATGREACQVTADLYEARAANMARRSVG
jgi:peroxiredoxin family protein